MSHPGPRKRRVPKLVLTAVVALSGALQTVIPEAVSAAPAVEISDPIVWPRLPGVQCEIEELTPTAQLSLTDFGAVADLTHPIDWARDPGVQCEIEELTPTAQLSLTDFGAVADDTEDDRPAFLAAINEARSLGGAVIHLPAGTLHVDGRVNLADGVVLRGAGMGVTQVLFTSDQDSGFELGGGYPQSAGPSAPATVTTAVSGQRGSTRLVVEDGSALDVGMLAQLTVGQQAHFSSRAGQVVEILAKRSAGTGDQVELILEEELSDDFAGFTVAGFVPIRGAGVEHLTVGPDDGVAVTHLIMMRGSADSWVTDVESVDALKAHVMMRYSYHCEVTGNRFSDALSHGDGGRGYGVNIANRTTGCLVENNDFELLRHSMLLQDGAVGNVVAFNRSGDSRHTNFADGGPADISFHGYAVANLVEGNVVERIHLSDAGVPGPFNTILRNCLTSGPLTLDGPTRDERLLGNAMFGTNEELRSRMMPAFETLSEPRPFLMYNDVFDADGILVLDPSENLVLHQNWYQGTLSGTGLGAFETVPVSLYGSSFAPLLNDPSSVGAPCQGAPPLTEENPEVDQPNGDEVFPPPVIDPVDDVAPPPFADPSTMDDVFPLPAIDPPAGSPPVVDDVTPPEARIKVQAGRGRDAGKVTIRGNATDNQAIDVVRITVRDTRTGDFLQDDLTRFAADRTSIEVSVSSDGKFAAPRLNLPDGSYHVTALAVDVAGNVQTAPASERVLVARVKRRGESTRFGLNHSAPKKLGSKLSR